MKLRCSWPGCWERSPWIGFFDWLFTGLLSLDWNFWLCEEHRKMDLSEAEEELRKRDKLA